MKEPNENNPKKKVNVEKELEEGLTKLKAQLEEHNGDWKSYIKQYNRHTLNIRLINGQSGEEEWVGKTVHFYNEDNAISHLDFLVDMLELLLEEENLYWGCGLAKEELVERITDFVRKRVSPPTPKKGARTIGEIAEEMKNNEKKCS